MQETRENRLPHRTQYYFWLSGQLGLLSAFFFNKAFHPVTGNISPGWGWLSKTVGKASAKIHTYFISPEIHKRHLSFWDMLPDDSD